MAILGHLKMVILNRRWAGPKLFPVPGMFVVHVLPSFLNPTENTNEPWQIVFPNLYNRDQSFELLKQYHQREGHTNVPRFWKEDNRLGQWCYFQRTTKYRRKPEEIAKLDSLGFQWEEKV